MNCSTKLAEIHIGSEASVEEAQSSVGSLYQVLQSVTDQRKRRGRRYEAAVIMVIILVAKMTGERTMSGIAQWARLRADWLCQMLPLRELPCANTYQYICEHIDLSELNAKLSAYFEVSSPPVPAVTAQAPAAGAELASTVESMPLVHLACDGKELRGTYRRSTVGAAGATGHPMQGALGIYNVTNSYMQALVPIERKGKEAAALTAYMAKLDCRRYLITADALHTQRRLCRLIVRQQGHYLLVVKRNQRSLYEDIHFLFSLKPNEWFPEQSAYTVDNTHGRIEVRRIRTSTELNAYLADRWPGVAQCFQVERKITQHGRTTTTLIAGLTSLPPHLASPERLLDYLRNHWQIENRSHWRRDATLGEDACKVASAHAALALAAINNTILALFDRLGFDNARTAIRIFSARPADALALILHPP
jgi:predicted transposase YbfD/YdcC